MLDRILNDETGGEVEDSEALTCLIRLMGKTGVCSNLLKEAVQCKLLDCSIKILMQREFIDVLLPWVSRIVHDASSSMVTKGANQTASKLLSLDQLSNLFECLLALLKEADPLCGPDNE